MRIQIMSDLHLEFHPDRGRQFIELLDSEGIDALVLAGDICLSGHIHETLDALCNNYSAVIYVFGNHEFYRSGFESIRNVFNEASKRLHNLYVLDNSMATVCGKRILGTTLWFPKHATNPDYEKFLNDFNYIKNFRERVYEENRLAVKFLEENISKEDIIVTHHLPSMVNVPDKFKTHPLVHFFVCELDHLIRRQQPKLWIHGHTHRSCNYRIGTTPVICNPYGYYEREQNMAFNPQLSVDI